MADLFAANEAPVVLDGTLTHVVFANPENGWTVARFEVSGRPEPVTIVGSLAGVQAGATLQVRGTWEEDRRFGRQFRVATHRATTPSTLTGIERFLGSGLLHGVGPAMAKRMVETFGLDTLRVLDEEPHKLRKVRGLGRARLRTIQEAWKEQRALRDVMVFLQSLGLGPAQALRIHQHYGDQSIERVQADPYQLARDIHGIGFRRADAIARGLGVAVDSEQRMDAVLEHVLGEAAEEGHCYLPRPDLVERCGEYLKPEKGASPGDATGSIAAAIERQAQARRVVVEHDETDDAVYLARLHRHEVGCAQRLRELQQTPAPPLHADPEAAVTGYEAQSGIQLSRTQRSALLAALQHKVLLITGGPGTGKTTLVRGIVQLAERGKRRAVLGAPTGRAAKRLAEATRTEAATLHRLLEWTPQTGGFQRDRANPLHGDVFVVDEVSMLDLPLMHALLRALPDDARLVCVGDADQLPPVGPGAVLRDLIASERVETIRLTEIFRQEDGSRIVASAHRIRAGEPPDLPAPGEPADFVLVQRDEPAALLEALSELVARRLPARLGLEPGRDLQVLVPMHRGPIGVEAVNQELQRVLNPRGEPIPGTPFRVGDKVMQVRNNYALDVFNGDIGRIEAVEPDPRRVLVRLDDRMLRYEAAELDQLVLAYACTVHKSQGSEYPAVVVVLHSQHHIMLQRNLLYTAVTRAKRQVVLLGQKRALMTALHAASVQPRFTRLGERLKAR